VALFLALRVDAGEQVQQGALSQDTWKDALLRLRLPLFLGTHGGTVRAAPIALRVDDRPISRYQASRIGFQGGRICEGKLDDGTEATVLQMADVILCEALLRREGLRSL
jgi:hypothetical protein